MTVGSIIIGSLVMIIIIGSGIYFYYHPSGFLTGLFATKPPIEQPVVNATVSKNDTNTSYRLDLSTLEKRQHLEMLIHEKVNEYRVSKGIEPLGYDERLAKIARAHSQDMADNGYQDHINKDGQNPDDRAYESGYICDIKPFGGSRIGENISWSEMPILFGRNYEQMAELIIDSWINSPPHAAQYTIEYYNVEGIGVAMSSDSTIYVTENFC